MDQSTLGCLISHGMITCAARDFPEEHPTLRPVTTNKERDRKWGDHHSPTFVQDHLLLRECPLFKHPVCLHRLVMPDYLAACRAILDARLEPCLLAQGESYQRTLDHGSTDQWSAHAWGIAIDWNTNHNPFGSEPATPTQLGCLYSLVPLMHQHNFVWGGHRQAPRKEGCHFEHV
jgi:hypothetical protein